MEDLKQHALGRFRSKLQQLGVSELIVNCIREIYTTILETERGLRDAVIEIAKSNRSKLWGKKASRDLIYEGGDFVVNLLGKLY
ncbi:hypothetical protein F5Y16DRAFT_363433 [Xylariaceae sp. FL0255]|nr:hypothetical protein F5Y16DRAFT_363433 [Xylariaceae sp. FL0255]